ncbi:MAG: MoaD/ThiS family protein [Chloroflexota bacterium]
MRVQVKVFATLVRSVPNTRAGVAFDRHLPEDASVADLIASLGLAAHEVRLVFVNGLAKDTSHILAPDDEVGIFPPVGGG